MKEVVFLIFGFLAAAIYTLIAVITFYSEADNTRTTKAVQKKSHFFCIVAILGFAARIVCFFLYSGHKSDMDCFYSWSDSIFKNGFNSFYSGDMFADYPPGYMYILYIIGFIKNTFNLSRITTYMLLKLPAAICDILCGFVVHHLAEKSENIGLGKILTTLFIFNPAVIFNSSVWGQVDSVFTLFVLLMLYALHNNKLYISYYFFAIAIFIKPQALFYAPVLLYGIIEKVFLDDFSIKKLLKNLLHGISSIIMIFVLCIPFDIGKVFNQYLSTIKSYNYISVNAYNFWTALNLNWYKPNFFINAVGYIFIAVIVIISAVIFFSKKRENRYFYTPAFICFSTFMLSVRMHERYAFPAIVLMLCACSISMNKKEFLIYLGISVAQLLNMVHVLFYYEAEEYFESGYLMPIILSLITVIFFIYFLLYTKKAYINPATAPATSDKVNHNITRKDFAFICIITAIYSVIALYNLGDKKAPQTYAELTPDTPISVDLGTDTDITQILFYLGPSELSEQRTLDVKITDEEGNTTYSNSVTSGNVFYWNNISEINAKGRYITCSSSDKLYLMELSVFDNSYYPIYIESNTKKICDEQYVVPEMISYKNSTYFDEIYHARTAYEFIHKMDVYEWTHPPLGKVFISLGIKMFDMTPFGWRVIGTIFGIFMIPVIYIFLKKIFGITWLTVCGTLLFTFDFMHFAQTRISTIDVYVTFFIMLMYLFMYKYYTMDASVPLKRMLIPLGLSGISMGFAISCKWTGVYAAIGLAVIFFIAVYNKLKEDYDSFKPKLTKTILFCILMFVIVPLLIYGLSYIPFMRSNGTGIKGIFNNQFDMLTYHGSTVVSATHDYSSPWYQWPVIFRPIWFFSSSSEGLSQNISSFGNPLVWWTGILALIYCIYDAIKYKNRTALFLVIGYFTQLVPWIPVTRITFIYHYFPCVPFIVMLITHSAYRLYQKNKLIKPYFITFAVFAIMLFIMFYPSLSGYPVNAEYVKTYLQWLPSWHLTN